MSPAQSIPAIAAAKASAEPFSMLPSWADNMLAILFAAFALACAGRSLQMMWEIPADAVSAIAPAESPAAAPTMAAIPRPPRP